MAYNFNKIASTYDRLNHIMTLGLDRQWRKRAVKEFSTLNSQFSVLDVACGTGDMVVELVKRGCMVTGVDLSEEMLAIALHKIKHTPSPLRGTPPNLGGELGGSRFSLSYHLRVNLTVRVPLGVLTLTV